ncbi:MAG: hypothetical protein WA997_11075 [Anaerolineales bacterium]|nr:hypothetical protein [Anaerolineales bacterium]
MGKKILVQQTSAGEPVEVNGLTVYPVARSYRINMPGARGGIVWNRPLAVIVEDADGTRQILPVIDRTRQLQIAIFSAGFIGTLLTWLIFRKSRKPAQKEK